MDAYLSPINCMLTKYFLNLFFSLLPSFFLNNCINFIDINRRKSNQPESIFFVCASFFLPYGPICITKRLVGASTWVVKRAHLLLFNQIWHFLHTIIVQKDMFYRISCYELVKLFFFLQRRKTLLKCVFFLSSFWQVFFLT